MQAISAFRRYALRAASANSRSFRLSARPPVLMSPVLASRLVMGFWLRIIG